MRSIFKSRSNKNESQHLNWLTFSGLEELQQLLTSNKTCVIFKHSTRCSISSTALSRIDISSKTNVNFYLIDVINQRELSDFLSDFFQIKHESPQIFVINNGELVKCESHLSISNASFSALI